ncbi:F0F1 ATP synthase subunit delta [Amnibacterium sp. CER49]|uniref:F0F1 ATP synthase subunit delta n=1 Tax=Amnibacterium sp. CER49 TaxID=3039161 RepID=UPI00244CF370|nr:F0F1 ATP synthase subunit delta [Amnibacterium sp. CER49]MDH2445093.1 F0F1 ATP synthase subunit delta [Amnibacterium sp. CER49]
MGAATRSATAAAISALDDALHPGLLGRLHGGATADLGDELLAAARAIASSNQLTSLLADPTLDPKNRSQLIRRVFGDRLERRALQILESMAASRWSEPGDIVDAVEEVGFRALALLSDDPIDAQLFAVQRTVSATPEIELALGNGASPVEARVALVDRLLANASPATRSIVRHTVQLPGGRRPVEALERAERVVADARGRQVAIATVAKPLTQQQVDALEQRLGSGYGRKIVVNQVIDPALIGGVRIAIGDDVIDGSVRTRLDDLRLRIA